MEQPDQEEEDHGDRNGRVIPYDTERQQDQQEYIDQIHEGYARFRFFLLVYPMSSGSCLRNHLASRQKTGPIRTGFFAHKLKYSFRKRENM
jgi:hypothetical protein